MITIKTAVKKNEWDNFIKSHKESNFLQSWDFYEFHASRGNKVIRRLFEKDGKIIGAYAGVVENAKRGRYMAIAGGPILDWKDKALVKEVFKDIKEQGKQTNCVFVRVRPQLELSEQSLTLFKNLGFKKAPMYLSVEYAGLLDLNDSEEEILKNASQGFRRKLRKAEKNGIKIETSTDYKIAKEFYELEVAHAKRQGYVAFSKSFLEKQFKAFMENGEAIVYIAKKDGEILAENFMIFYGNEASYHYGVSTDLGTKYSAAPLLHMKAMTEARKRNITRYNLWGIVGLDEKEHRFYGVSEFKRSFGCKEFKYTPAHDLILKKSRYLLNKSVETARKKIRHV